LTPVALTMRANRIVKRSICSSVDRMARLSGRAGQSVEMRRSGTSINQWLTDAP
jgi:hypothetical protein